MGGIESATSEAKDTTAGWEIERSQTEDCLMQTPGSNMGANVSSFLTLSFSLKKIAVIYY